MFSEAVGKKERQIVLKSNGIENESVAKTESNTLSLTQNQVLLLGNAGVLIEKAFGCRLDIEWAFQEVIKKCMFLVIKFLQSKQFSESIIYIASTSNNNIKFMG